MYSLYELGMVQQEAIMMHVRELPQDSAEGNDETVEE
jgi:hypothetical protein